MTRIEGQENTIADATDSIEESGGIQTHSEEKKTKRNSKVLEWAAIYDTV